MKKIENPPKKDEPILKCQNGTSRFDMPIEQIGEYIYIIRGQKVILDQDLAMLYEVETKNLNKAINRNKKRFPKDFVFQLTKEEWSTLRFQNGTSKIRKGGRRYLPFAFTEHGVAMAASLLKSDRAIEVSVEIVRTFIKLREFFSIQKDLIKEFSELKSYVLKNNQKMGQEFLRIWKTIEKLSTPQKEERKIGFNLN